VRRSVETLIIGRTDAYGVEGLDEALRRGERFLSLGADGVFVAGLRTMADFEKVGSTFRGTTLLSAALFETPGMPWPSPAELGALGFTQVSYPATLMFRVADTIGTTLARLRRHADGVEPMRPDAATDARARLDDALELERWKAIERAL